MRAHAGGNVGESVYVYPAGRDVQHHGASRVRGFVRRIGEDRRGYRCGAGGGRHAEAGRQKASKSAAHQVSSHDGERANDLR